MHKRAIPNEHVLMRRLAVSLASSDALKVAFMQDVSSQEGLSIFLKDFSQLLSMQNHAVPGRAC